MRKRLCVLALNPLLVSWSGCQRQTWESATAAGQQACNKAITQTRNGFFGVAVSLSQLAQVYAGQGKYMEGNRCICRG
jgi:hypothetical protein